MREILFKGKRTDNGEWVEGFYSNELYANKHYISAWYYGSYAELQKFEVDPETVGQFVGDNDVNNKKVFEGDIIAENVYRNRYVVIFKENAFCYAINNKGGYWEAFADGEYGMTLADFEVIGNIHDNPELLEAEE